MSKQYLFGRWRGIGCLLLLIVLGACAVPSSKYYSLKETRSATEKLTATAYQTKKPDFAITVHYVDVPVQVDRPQIVLTDPDTTEVSLLNDSQWAAPLADEIRLALMNDLLVRLNAVDLSLVTGGIDLPGWLIDLDVLQFNSFYEHQVQLAASWRMQSRGQANRTAVVCQAEVRLPVADGINGLVEGHRQAVQHIGQLIAAYLKKEEAPHLSGTTDKGCVALDRS